jgi:hypothetical protein
MYIPPTPRGPFVTCAESHCTLNEWRGDFDRFDGDVRRFVFHAPGNTWYEI